MFLLKQIPVMTNFENSLNNNLVRILDVEGWGAYKSEMPLDLMTRYLKKYLHLVTS